MSDEIRFTEETINAIIKDLRFFGGVFVTSEAAREIRRALHEKGIRARVNKNINYDMGISIYPYRISL